MVQPRYTDLIAAYLAGDITPEQRAELLRWLEEDPEHRVFFDQMVEVWTLAAEYEEPEFPRADPHQAWNRLEGRLFGEAPAAAPAYQDVPASTPMPTGAPAPAPTGPRVRRLLPRRWVAAAAVVALLALGWWWISIPSDRVGEWVAISTGAGERREVNLPDGSSVWLNEQSTLRYLAAFEERTLELAGEAFFEVTPDTTRPFRIESGGAVTTVLGTSFNLRAYPREPRVEVTVATGKVALSEVDDPDDKVVLEPGETGIYARPEQKVLQRESALRNADAWREQRLDFNDQELVDVVPALERYFNVNIEVENEKVLKCTFKGEYENPDLDNLLATLEFAMKLQIRRQADTIVLAGGEGCD